MADCRDVVTTARARLSGGEDSDGVVSGGIAGASAVAVVTRKQQH